MFEVICDPIPLIDNHRFLECWNILLETAFVWKLKIYCEGNGLTLLRSVSDLNTVINTDEFPFNI